MYILYYVKTLFLEIIYTYLDRNRPLLLYRPLFYRNTHTHTHTHTHIYILSHTDF